MTFPIVLSLFLVEQQTREGKNGIKFWRKFWAANGVCTGRGRGGGRKEGREGWREGFPREFLTVEQQSRLNDIVYYFNDVISGI